MGLSHELPKGTVWQFFLGSRLKEKTNSQCIRQLRKPSQPEPQLVLEAERQAEGLYLIIR